MASDILHIKDSFYFEVPRGLWKKQHNGPQEFFDAYGPWVIRNDPAYQQWEAVRVVQRLEEIIGQPGKLDGLIDQWQDWQHARPARHGRPLDQYLADELTSLQRSAQRWGRNNAPAGTSDLTGAYLETEAGAGHPLAWMHQVVSNAESNRQWRQLQKQCQRGELTREYLQQPDLSWSQEQIDGYNKSLSGKIFIPQPFATLRNA